MIAGFCSIEECPVAKTGHCFETKPKVEDCPNWKPKSAKFNKEKTKSSEKRLNNRRDTVLDEHDVIWSGYPLQLADIELISRRSNPLIIALVGESFAGKSSFLGMLHTLFLAGHQLENYTFAGSLSLLGWEELAASLRFSKGQATEPTPTPSDPFYYSFLHWTLRQTDSKLADIIFADASGEVFSQWAIDRDDPNAENVRWIHRNADAFVFFVSCKSIAEGRSAAITKLIDLANRLKEGLNGRPVVIVWAKADYMEKVRPVIKQRVDEQIGNIFKSAVHFETSKYLQDNPDQKQINNLLLLNELLEIIKTRRLKMPILNRAFDSQDPFLMYQGDEAGQY